MGTCRLVKTVFDVVNDNIQKWKAISKAQVLNTRADHIEKVVSAASIKALGKLNRALNVAQLKVMIDALKRKGDPVVPSLTKYLLVRLTEYEIRSEQLMVVMKDDIGGQKEEEQEGFDDETNNDVDRIIMNDIQEALV